MFQSLFWWILLLNLKFSMLITDGIRVSILVLVDFALKLDFPTDFWETRLRFQSLFWWILLLNTKSKESLSAVEGSFNPCFGGFCS